MTSIAAVPTDSTATSSAPEYHTATLRIPFANNEHATIAKRVIEVDRELNSHIVHREMKVDGKDLVVTYHAASVRLLRLSTNGFIENVNLVIRTISEFGLPSD